MTNDNVARGNSEQVDKAQQYLAALRSRCSDVAVFGPLAAAASPILVSEIRYLAAALQKRLEHIETLLGMFAAPAENCYLFEMSPAALRIRIEKAVARKGVTIVDMCVATRTWVVPPPQEELLNCLFTGRTRWCYAFRERVAEELCAEHPWLEPAYKTLGRIGGMASPAEATGDLINGPSLDLVCRATELAVGLLESAARSVPRPLPRVPYDDDSDKPRTDSDWQARTSRLNGWSEPDRRTRYRPPAGGGYDSALARGVLGADDYAYSKTWLETDERIYIGKRGGTRRAYLGPATVASVKQV
jgi:hypothetical protein